MASEPVALTLVPGLPKLKGQGKGEVLSLPQRKSSETCPKGHGFMHLNDLRSMFDEKTGRWRVRCANCAVQKVFYRVDNSCDLGARWDGQDAGFWYL